MAAHGVYATTDTPWGLKPDGFSGYVSERVIASTLARERLHAVPPPTRTVTPSPGERGSRKNAGACGAHQSPGRVAACTPGNDVPGNRQTACDWQGATVSEEIVSNKRTEAERQQDFRRK